MCPHYIHDGKKFDWAFHSAGWRESMRVCFCVFFFLSCGSCCGCFITLGLCWSYVGYLVLLLRGETMTTSSPDVSVSTPESRPADSLESWWWCRWRWSALLVLWPFISQSHVLLSPFQLASAVLASSDDSDLIRPLALRVLDGRAVLLLAVAAGVAAGSSSASKRTVFFSWRMVLLLLLAAKFDFEEEVGKAVRQPPLLLLILRFKLLYWRWLWIWLVPMADVDDDNVAVPAADTAIIEEDDDIDDDGWCCSEALRITPSEGASGRRLSCPRCWKKLLRWAEQSAAAAAAALVPPPPTPSLPTLPPPPPPPPRYMLYWSLPLFLVYPLSSPSGAPLVLLLRLIIVATVSYGRGLRDLSKCNT